MALLSDDNDRLVAMIPVQLRNLSSELKARLKELFNNTEFDCSECGGDCIPFSEEQGVCFQCKTVANLHDLHYEVKEREESDGNDDPD